MRALIDIDETRVQELDRIAKKERRSRAALIREAVDDLLARRGETEVDEAFGLWGERITDGVAYQDKIRSEW